VIAATVGAIARARGMTAVAKGAGITRDALYKSLVADGDPRLSTVLGVMKALGVKLTPAAI
jgi:probable addiction module antidote protein